ncbi:unnamed protein product [Adineta ricciae]|uniref:Uncharacterized protein n=1 Tax=Adineta ricciae TaxID=249248 RepID=A0A814YQS8_ADIRI|nr:unnamed protein product [Adineta ricciae]CAF1269237.1 unnamed protein product [Adineta ricciae]
MPSNSTSINEISSNETQGAIAYIVVVIVWYGIGFGIILLDNIRQRTHQTQQHRYKNVYQAVNDLYEQTARKDILIQLKDNDKRQKIWNIYYSTEKSCQSTVEKDKEAGHSITKQLTEQHRLLRNTLNDLSLDPVDDDETE